MKYKILTVLCVIIIISFQSCGDSEVKKPQLSTKQKAEKIINDYLNCLRNRKTIEFANLEVMTTDLHSECPFLYPDDDPSGEISFFLSDSLSKHNNHSSFVAYDKVIQSLGEGWRIPTIEELIILYKNKDEIGGFYKNEYYLSSTPVDERRNLEGYPTDVYGIAFWDGEISELSTGITISGAKKRYNTRAVRINQNKKSLCDCVSDRQIELTKDFSPECDWIPKMPNTYWDTAYINAWDKCPTLFDNSMTTFENGPYAFLENHSFIDENALIGTESLNTRQNFELLFANGKVILDKGNYHKEQELTYTVEKKFWNDTNRIYKEVYDIAICGSNHYAYGKCFNVLLYRQDNGDYECHVRGDYFYKAFLKIKPKYVIPKTTKNENKELSQEAIENALEKAADLEDDSMN